MRRVRGIGIVEDLSPRKKSTVTHVLGDKEKTYGVLVLGIDYSLAAFTEDPCSLLQDRLENHLTVR